MDINKILQSLGIDFSDPEAKRGAIEAIDAILQSRQSVSGGGEGGEFDVDVDPDLVQPSIKQSSDELDDADTEINDEEDLLSQVKHNESEEDTSDNNITKDDSEESSKSASDDDQEDDEEGESSADNDNSEVDSEASDDAADSEEASDTTDTESDNTDDIDDDDTADNNLDDDADDSDDADAEVSEPEETPKQSKDNQETLDDSEDDFDDDSDTEEEIDEDEEESNDDFDFDEEDEFDDEEDVEEWDEEEEEIDEDEEADSEEDEDEPEDDSDDDEPEDDSVGLPGDSLDSSEDDSEDEDEDEDGDGYDFDEDDLIDDSLKDIEDEEKKSKADMRKIKRDRVLDAARNTLIKAKTSNAPAALVRELEQSIAALEALTEAVTKSIKDISDEEFNQLVNRVFDAIDALGDKSLTFSSDDDRKLRAKEIQTDLSDRNTQADLSAEDAAAIRAEHQAVKAREKENAKYQTKARGSFKGFQEFLNSLYRAVALQVNTEEERADTWSAISRRNSGAGVLQQGKLVKELNNKKIPVIDIYIDQSASWDEEDIKIGEKAVQSLADMEAKGDIKINLYYFSNGVHSSAADARAEGGTGAWNDIVKNIIATNATNVIVITDADMEDVWFPRRQSPLRYTVPGYVWYLWKNGLNAPRLPRDLKGRGGVQQFSFNASDV